MKIHKKIFQSVRKQNSTSNTQNVFSHPKTVSSNSLFSLSNKNSSFLIKTTKLCMTKNKLNCNQQKIPLQNSMNLNLPDNLVKSFVANHENQLKPKTKKITSCYSRKLISSENIEEFENEAHDPKMQSILQKEYEESQIKSNDRSTSFRI